MNGEKLKAPVEGLVHSIPMSPPLIVLLLPRIGIGMDGDGTLGVGAVVAAKELDEEATSLPIARSVKMVELVGVVMLSNIYRAWVGGVSLETLYTRC